MAHSDFKGYNMEWIVNNIDVVANLALIGIVLAICCTLYKRGEIERLKQVVLAFVIQAEKTLGSGTGSLKYALVIEAIYNYIPSILRFLFSEEELDALIEDAVKRLKDSLKGGSNLLSSAEEKLLEGE